MGLSIVLFALLPAVYFGWERNSEYVTVALRGMSNMAKDICRLSSITPGSEGLRADDTPNSSGVAAANISKLTWDRSVSIPSAMARAIENRDHPRWVPFALAAVVALGVFCAVWGLFARAGVALFVGRWPNSDDADLRFRAVVLIEWMGLIVAALMFSPQTTARHMVMLFPVCVAAAWLIVAGRPGTPRRLVVASCVVLVLGLTLPPGSAAFFSATTWWRSVGGASWCLMVMYLGLLEAGLREAIQIGPSETIDSATYTHGPAIAT
jgi:hypothetical protein